jgi:hypothetical protein
MAMGTVAATNIKTGGAQNVQWQEKGVYVQVTSAAVTTGLATNDIITGPSIPAGAYLVDILVDVTDIDGATTAAFTVGIVGTTAKFISSSTAGQAGGIARMNVAAALGYSPAADTPVILTMTAGPATPVAGTIKIAVFCTNTP